MDRILPLASPPPPARLFFLPDAAHAWREEVDGTTASLGVQHLSNAYFRKSLEEVSSSALLFLKLPLPGLSRGE